LIRWCRENNGSIKGISLRFLHQRGGRFEAIFQTSTLRTGGGSQIIDVSQENARMEEI